MRRVAMLLAVGSTLLTAGCGGSHPTATVAADPQVNSGMCETSSLAAKPRKPASSCTFVLNDGRRLGCNRSFKGPTPSVPQLVRDGCRWLTPLKLSGSVRALIARIDGVKACLDSKQLRASGGAVLPPSPPGPPQPDGEIVVASTSPAFIAFYTNVGRAKRLEPAVLA